MGWAARAEARCRECANLPATADCRWPRVRSSTMIEPDFVRATRAFYDTVAAAYTERFSEELAARPLERALLGAFAERVRESGAGPVGDLGCGPGNISALLHALGVPVFGIDLSAHMVELARRTYPGLRFDQGSMLSLDLADGSFGGLLAWYSTIHTPDERLPGLFAELARVLAPGGEALIAFQTGAEPRHVTSQDFGLGGDPVGLTFLRRSPRLVIELLERAGLTLRAQVVREPEGWEQSRQAFLFARKEPESAADEAA